MITTNSYSQEKKSVFNFLPSVQISTPDVELDIEIQAHFKTSNIIIRAEVDFLRQLLQRDNDHRLLDLITRRGQSYLYEDVVSPKIQSVAAEIFNSDVDNTLKNFYYQVKSEELIYLFMTNLLQRDRTYNYPVNQSDIKVVYRIREDILNEMNSPPELNILAAKANMSVSKLGKIFYQIFGDSIYNYYQKMRMQKAAFLLRNEKLSVSEVGYQLGFSNLSHFARLFEKHMGIKPKKYSSTEL